MEEKLLLQETWSEEQRAAMEDKITKHLMDNDVESQSLAPVLQRKYKTTTLWGLFIVWFTASIKAASWACGALATTVYGLSPLGAVLSLAAGNILGGILVYLTAAMGRNGVPQSMLMIPIFGRKGAKVPQFLLYVTVLGWTIANTVFSTLLGRGIVNQYFPNAGSAVSVIILLLLTASSVWVANKKFDLVVKWLTPVTYLMILILIVMTVFVVRDVDWSAQANEFASQNDFSLTIMFISCMGALGIGYLGTWAPFASDFSRYVNMENKSMQRKTGFISALSGWIVCTWLLGVGALFGYMYGGVDPAMHIAQSMPFFVVPALIVVLVGSWSTLVVNYISVGIDLKGLGLKVNRNTSTLINAGIVVVLGLISLLGTDIASAYSSFLLFLVLWVVPWVCIQAMDYFMVAKGDYSLEGIYGLNNTYDGWNWRGLITMVVGFFASYIFCYPGDITIFGVIPLYSPLMVKYFYFGDFSFFVGAVVTCIVYYFVSIRPRLQNLKGAGRINTSVNRSS